MSDERVLLAPRGLPVYCIQYRNSRWEGEAHGSAGGAGEKRGSPAEQAHAGVNLGFPAIISRSGSAPPLHTHRHTSSRFSLHVRGHVPTPLYGSKHQ